MAPQRAKTQQQSSATVDRGAAPDAPRIGGIRTLSIDIGGTGLKASVLDEKGALRADRVRVKTPVGRPPEVIVETLAKLVTPLAPFDRISVGFPGVVRDGKVLTAPMLGHKAWKGFNLATALSKRFGKPVRILNDADMQGLAVIKGKGVEMVITLGTGLGTGLYVDGHLGPHLELAHHPFRKGETYNEQLGNAARKRIGNKKWSKRVRRAISTLRSLTTFDHLYIGGGNAKKVTLKLDPDTTIVSNEAGIAGGIALWRD
jgi:polyphosphate glucokinase